MNIVVGEHAETPSPHSLYKCSHFLNVDTQADSFQWLELLPRFFCVVQGGGWGGERGLGFLSISENSCSLTGASTSRVLVGLQWVQYTSFTPPHQFSPGPLWECSICFISTACTWYCKILNYHPILEALNLLNGDFLAGLLLHFQWSLNWWNKPKPWWERLWRCTMPWDRPVNAYEWTIMSTQ